MPGASASGNPGSRFRIGSTIFYIAWPLTLGLTHYHPAGLERHPRTDFLIIWRGLLASLLGFMAGLICWFLGVHSDFLLAWTLNNAFYVAISLIPFKSTFRRSDPEQ